MIIEIPIGVRDNIERNNFINYAVFDNQRVVETRPIAMIIIAFTFEYVSLNSDLKRFLSSNIKLWAFCVFM